jgi:hypothetical protein
MVAGTCQPTRMLFVATSQKKKYTTSSVVVLAASYCTRLVSVPHLRLGTEFIRNVRRFRHAASSSRAEWSDK